MAKIRLPDYFNLIDYQLKETDNLVEVSLIGERVGKPSKRFTLYGSGLKIKDVAIQSESKNKLVDFQIERINYLPTFQEIRFHTKNLQYPGQYKIRLACAGKSLREMTAYFDFT